MLSISLRDEVQKAIAGEWRIFSERHPHLAKVIDQTLLIEQATASLGDDPEFREAMETAAVAGVTTEAVINVVRRFVQKWLKQLI